MTFTINELTTGRYTATVVDETGGFPSLDTLTLTLYNNADKSVINNRNAQSVLNTNGATYNASTGALVWTLDPNDSPIIDDTLDREVHVAEFKGTYNGGKVVRHRVVLVVHNLEKTP